MHQRVVLVAGEGELRNRLFEALGAFSAEAVEVPSATRALELTRELPVHLTLVDVDGELVRRIELDGLVAAAMPEEEAGTGPWTGVERRNGCEGQSRR